MMLIIAVHCYRATVHSLKPDVNRQKLKIFCDLAYLLALIAGYGAVMPFCITQLNDAQTEYNNFFASYIVISFGFFPTAFMAVLYYNLG